VKPEDVEDYALAEYYLSKTKRYDSELSRIPIEFEGACVLDLAGGPGTWTKIFSDAGARKVVWTDRSVEFLRFARRYLQDYSREGRVAFVMSDLAAIPFADRTFDLVYCRLALHHSKDEKSTLEEIARVLRRGGLLVLIAQRIGLVRQKVPFGPKKPFHFVSPYLELALGKKFLPTLYHLERPLLQRIRRAGLTVEVCDTSNRTSMYVVARKRPLEPQVEES
jgi:ubiquinone/menaquinone biosynthesis C-methylase UbiE